MFFLVWDDSFDAYMAARSVADAGGFSAGWDPYDQHKPYRHDLIRPGRGGGSD